MSESSENQQLEELEYAQAGGRSVIGRLVIQGGQLCCVRSEPTYKHFSAFENPGEVDLAGWRMTDTWVVNLTWLKSRCDDLTRWKNLLDEDVVKATLPDGPDDALAEIGSLREQLSDIADVYCDFEDGRFDGDQLVLHHEVECEYQQLLSELFRHHRYLVQPWGPVLRAVVWVRGVSAARRLVAVILELQPTEDDIEKIHATRRILSVLRRVAKRHGHRRTGWREEWIRAYKSWPIGLRHVIGLRYPAGDLDIALRLKVEMRRCTDYLSNMPMRLPRKLLTGLAALCCFDRSECPIPSGFVIDKDTNGYRDAERLQYAIESLLNRRDSECYGVLIELVSEGVVDEYRVGQAANLLKGGTSEDDLRWLSEEELFPYLEDCAVDVRPLRMLAEFFDEFVVSESPLALKTNFCELLHTPADGLILEHVHHWLMHQRNRTLKPKLVRELLAVFENEMRSAQVRKLFSERMAEWSQPNPKEAPVDLGDATVSDRVLKLLNTLGYYQQLADEPVRVPKSVRKRMKFADRCLGELETLKQDREAGALTEKAAHRLEYLEKATNLSCLSEDRLVRELEDAVATTAIRALQVMIRQSVVTWWNDTFRTVSVPESTSLLFDFCDWFLSRSREQRVSIRELFRSWVDHGADYRRFLMKNQAWIKTARTQRIDVDAWLGERGAMIEAQGERYRVEVSTNPLETMRMGSYFDTCLGLREGENRHSVLPNIYDANKAVIYVYDSRGVVAARRLVAICDPGKLIRYSDYVNSDDDDLRVAMSSELDRFCGLWARDANLGLGHEGTPTRLSHEWYDDGSEQWEHIAHKTLAGSGEKQPAEVVSSHVA